jgi:GH43 family beta-xylosidase
VFVPQERDEDKPSGPRRNSFFKSPEGMADWIVYPAWGWRVTRAQRFTWRADGTPDFGRPIPPGEAIPVPAGEPLE